MCEAAVYLDDELIVRDVVSVRVLPEGVRLATLFESPRLVQATVREIDLANHRVILAPLAWKD